ARHAGADGGASAAAAAESAEFVALRRTYMAELPNKLGLIGDAVAAVFAGRDPTALDAVCDLAHRLVGPSALYRLPPTHRAARALGARAMALAKAGSFAAPAQRPELDSRVAALWSAQPK